MVERLVSVMAAGPAKVQLALVDAHQSLPAESLGEAFVAACRSRKPAEVFKLFGPYLEPDAKKKPRDPAFAKRDAILKVILQGRRGWYFDSQSRNAEATLDPQWLDLAVKLENLDLVEMLAVPGHAKANDLLGRQFKQRMAKSKDEHESVGIIATMARVQHPQATDAAIELIQKLAKSKYGYYYWVGRLIPQLPKAEALPKLEALLPTLPEKMIDQLLDYVTELKNSPETE